MPFDVWAHESLLYAGEGEHRGFAGEVGKALADLDGESLLYDEEGAVWLKTTQYGDDKDRVLIRSSGDPTYFLSDIAYHRDKMDRGFAHMIDIWGADHHGYVPRMKAAFTALPPHEPDRLELIIGQMVNLLESGEAKRMSKRKGDIVTVDDLLDAIGVDAARFLLVGRSHDTTLELDIDLAREQSNKNPVYYVQYAHARICSILRNLEGRGGAGRPAQPCRLSPWTSTRGHWCAPWRGIPKCCSRPPTSARLTACPPISVSWPRSSTGSIATAACSATTPTPPRSGRRFARPPETRWRADSRCSA